MSALAGFAPPVVSIVLEFERRAPQIRCVWMNDGDEARMVDWLGAQPELLRLIEIARELERQEPAA